MKKILFAAFAVSLLTVGCQKTEIIHQVAPTDGSLMSFSTEMSKLTKSSDEAESGADKDGMYNLRAQEFRIWAYCDYEDTNTDYVEYDQIYDGIENLNISYDKPADHEDKTNDIGTWAPTKQYYWPSAGKSLRFFAVSGENDATVTPEINRDSETGAASPTLTVANYKVNNISPNTDLMVADFILQEKNTANTDKRVTFNFNHALSKVQFLFKTTESAQADVYIQSLEVKKIKTQATLTVSNNGETFKWDTYSEEKPFTDNDQYAAADEDFSKILSDIEKLDASASDDATVYKLKTTPAEFATWLVLPQDIVTKDAGEEITGGLKVEVLYVIGKRQFKAEFPLYVKGSLEKWDVNQYTKYLVTITPNKITFSATAEPWTPYNSSDDNKDGDDIILQN